MSAIKSSLLAAGAIIAGAGAATLGMVARDHADVPSRTNVSLGEPPSTRVASRSDSQDLTDIPEREYFEQMTLMLKREYVDPINDEQKLVTGAVRGMVASLEDTRSMFMDKDEFRVFESTREGKYEGIGIDVSLVMPPKRPTKPSDPPQTRIPKVIVAAVVPGGPADKAGIKSGDVIDTIDEHWVINSDIIDRFRVVQEQVTAKKLPADALKDLRSELRKKMDKSLLPVKAKDKLCIGESGAVSVTWIHDGQKKTASITKAKSELAAVKATENTFAVHLGTGTAAALDHALPTTGTVTLDLRNNAFADMASIKETLGVLAPSGTYGSIVSEKPAAKTEALQAGGTKRTQVQYVLLVDRSTASGAEIVAKALRDKGLAKFQGTTAGDAYVAEVVKLPDGSGFSLVKGMYKGGAK